MNPSPALEEGLRTYRPIDLARSVGLSASQIRNYERVGFLPRARRTSTGYRVYTDHHLVALHAARCLQRGYGWQRAVDALRAVHAGDAAAALAVGDERHADLHAQRGQVAEALAGLASARRDVGTVLGLRLARGRTVSIGQVATALGVNTSALRYWESRGLVRAARGPSGRRHYGHRQLQQLQLVKLLRDVNYSFDAIRTVIEDLAEPTGTRAIQALEERRQRIDAASIATAEATRALLGYIERLRGLDAGVTRSRAGAEPEPIPRI